MRLPEGYISFIDRAVACRAAGRGGAIENAGWRANEGGVIGDLIPSPFTSVTRSQVCLTRRFHQLTRPEFTIYSGTPLDFRNGTLNPANLDRLSFGCMPTKRPYDPYLKLIRKYWHYIVMLYEQFAGKKPIMLFDVQEQRIYAMPYREYRAGLSKRSQASLKRQYEDALEEGGIVVFVRDNEKEILRSYTLPL